MTEETKKSRRKRRTKAEIEAEKAAKAAAAAEVKEMEAAGFEHVRARDEHGHFIADDPSTPENEAWEWVKKEEDKEIEMIFGSSYEKEIDEIVAEKGEDDIPYEPVVRDREAEHAYTAEKVKEEPKKEPDDAYIPMYGRNKKLNRLAQREKIQRIQDMSKHKHNE